jgi:hypothetical protein
VPRPVLKKLPPLLWLGASLLMASLGFAQEPDPFQSVPPPAAAAPRPAKPPPRPRPSVRERQPREQQPSYEPVMTRPVAPQPPPRPTVPDGNWEVHGSATSRQCGSWSVRIANSQGRLSGSFFVGDYGENVGLLSISGLALQPDGTFSGSGVTGSQGVYQFSGRISGDTMSLTMTSISARCPETRTGQGRRFPG